MKLFFRAASVAVICASFLGSVSAADMSVGIKGAFNLASTWGEDELDLSGLSGLEDVGLSVDMKKVMKPGLILGVFLETRLTDNFSVQPEVMYTSKGMKYEMDMMGITATSAVNFSYLEIPVLLKLNLPLGVAVPNIYAGPAVAFRIGTSGYAEAAGTKENMDDESIDMIKENTSGFDFGLAMGGGCNFVAGPGAIVLDIRYTLGFLKLMKLTDEMKDAGMESSDLPGNKNTALSFMIGYAFNIGG